MQFNIKEEWTWLSLTLSAELRYLKETRRPGDQETRGPEDQETRRPEDQETRGPGDQRTRRPEDQETSEDCLISRLGAESDLK